MLRRIMHLFRGGPIHVNIQQLAADHLVPVRYADHRIRMPLRVVDSSVVHMRAVGLEQRLH